MTSSPDEIVVDPAPFDLAGEGPAAALCLHGLTGTPYEVRPLGEAIAFEFPDQRQPWRRREYRTLYSWGSVTYDKRVEA